MPTPSLSPLEAAIEAWLSGSTHPPKRWTSSLGGQVGYGIDARYVGGDYGVGGLLLGVQRLTDGQVLLILGLDDRYGHHFYVPFRFGDGGKSRVLVDTRHSTNLDDQPDTCTPIRNGWHCSPVGFFKTVDEFFAAAARGAYDGALVRLPFLRHKAFRRFDNEALKGDYRELEPPNFVNTIPSRADGLPATTAVEVLVCPEANPFC